MEMIQTMLLWAVAYLAVGALLAALSFKITGDDPSTKKGLFVTSMILWPLVSAVMVVGVIAGIGVAAWFVLDKMFPNYKCREDAELEDAEATEGTDER